MVKPDVNKDYYAILGLKSDAASDDIRKAYHKLALKWHPDRNHGSEAEASSKFQDISAAYDILVDTSTRAKYDADRLRHYGKYAAFTSPTTAVPNPYANWPRPAQPPRPEPAPNAPPPNHMKSPTSGTAQYARWTAGKGPWPEANAAGYHHRAEAANAFRAWGNMKPGSTPGRGATGAERGGPPPGRGAAAPPPNMPPRRPAKTTTFHTTSGNAGPHATPKARAGWDQFDHNAPPPGLQRANTMRTPKKGGFDPGIRDGDEPPARNSSAYYHLHRGSVPHVGRPPIFNPRPPPQPSPQANGPPNSDHFKGFRSPKSEENINDRISTPYATSGGEKTYFSSEHLSRNPSSESASNLKSGWEDYASGRPSYRSPNRERHRSASPRMRSPNPQQSSSSSDESSDSDVAERKKLRPKGFAARYAAARNPAKTRDMPPPPKPFVTVEDPNGETVEFGKPTKSSTWTPDNANNSQDQAEKLSPGQAAFRRTSTGGVPEGARRKSYDTGKPKAQSPLHTATPLTNDDLSFEPLEKTQSWQETSNQRHFESPEECFKETNSFFANGSPRPLSPTKDSGAETSTSQFSQDVWQKEFSNNSSNPFNPSPNLGAEPRGRASPIKARSNTVNKTPRKMSAASKRPNFAMSASVSAASSDSNEDGLQSPSASKSTSRERSSNGSAMDIDSRTPPVPSEMRSTRDPLGNAIRSTQPNVAPLGPAVAPPAATKNAESVHLNLKDFSKSSPFASTNANGLGDIADLGANLPFDSKPASTLPTAEIHPHKLALPDAPRPPKAPSASALTRKDYDYYMVFVRKYMAEWNMFNQKMLRHFNARQEMIENRLPNNWLDSVGQEGYLKYMAWMEEDVAVRAHWDDSYKKHIETMKTLGDVRQVAIAGKWAG